MKNLLVTTRSISQNDEVYFSVDSNWFKYFNNHNLFALPNNLKVAENIYQHLNISGVILSGGGSIQSNDLDTNSHDPERERVEEYLIEKSISKNIPLITICRGTQKILTFLEQDIKFCENPIQIKEKFQLFNSDNIQVKKEKYRTCYNKFSIVNENLRNNWDVLFIDKYKNIQLIKHKKFKILSFMWHPERDFTDKKTISNFLE